MKKGLGTKRVLVVALTIAMLLQNSAGVLATDGTAAASETSQEQSTELQSAAPEQTDVESDQQETKASEKQLSETPAQTEVPQADAPKTETTETDTPKDNEEEDVEKKAGTKESSDGNATENTAATEETPQNTMQSETESESAQDETTTTTVSEEAGNVALMSNGASLSGEIYKIEYKYEYQYTDENGEIKTCKYKGEKHEITNNNPSEYNTADPPIKLQSATRIFTPKSKQYEFEGWYEDIALTKKVTEIPTGTTGDITLYGKWKGEGLVRYQLKNDETWTSIPSNLKQDNTNPSRYIDVDKYDRSKKVSAPNPAPSKTGYKFVEWIHTTSEGKTDYELPAGESKTYRYDGDFKESAEGADTLTLTAVWEPIKCKVVYHMKGGKFDGEGTTAETITKEYTVEDIPAGSDSIKLPIPTQSVSAGSTTQSYEFLGWYTKDATTLDTPLEEANRRNSISKEQIANGGEVHLYAMWRGMGRVRYWLEDAPVKTGAKWNISGVGVSLNESVDKTSTSYQGPYYIDDNYYHNPEKESIAERKNNLIGRTTVSIPLVEPTRPGYEFEQWYLEKKIEDDVKIHEYHNAGTDTTFEYGGSITTNKKGELSFNYQTFHADWKEYTATLTYQTADSGGGTVELTSQPGSASETVGVVTGTPAGATAKPSPGYHFVEWQKDGKRVCTTETLDVTAINENAKREADPSGLASAEDSVTFYTDSTFTAVFAPNTYTVKYDKNSDDATGTTEEQTYTFGEAQNLSANGFERLNYSFVGWALTAGATDVAYKDKDSFVINADNIGSFEIGTDNTITLYAVWVRGTPAKVEYELNGRNEGEVYKTENSPDNITEYWPGETTFTFQNPSYTVHPTNAGTTAKSYVFDGWYTDPGFTESSQKTEITTADRGDIKLYAKWRAVGRVRYYLNANDASWNLGTDADRIVPESSGSTRNFIDETDNYTDGTDKSLTGVGSFIVPQNAPTRTGYHFGGWQHDSINNKLPVGANSGTYNFPYPGDYDSKTGDPDRVTFHAQWTAYTYKVRFHRNAGETPETVKEQGFTYGVSDSLNPNGSIAFFTRPGYTFKGWAASASSATAQYQNGAVVSNWMIGENVVWPKEDGTVQDGATLELYAVWEPDFSRLKAEGFEHVYDGMTHEIVVSGTVAGDT